MAAVTICSDFKAPPRPPKNKEPKQKQHPVVDVTDDEVKSNKNDI